MNESINTFLERKITASIVPSAYIDLPQTLCWNSKETLQKRGGIVSWCSVKIRVPSYIPGQKEKRNERMLVITFGLVRWGDTYGKHDQPNAPLELPPPQFVAWDPGSFVSNWKFNKDDRFRSQQKKRSMVNKITFRLVNGSNADYSKTSKI